MLLSTLKQKNLQQNLTSTRRPIDRRTTGKMAIQGGGDEQSDPSYDRKSELQAFDDTKAGVKGLVDAGIKKLPRMFHHQPENVSTKTGARLDFPVIDLEKDRREVVDGVREAAATWGFFQVVNHGIPATVLDEMFAGVRRFMEQDVEIKKQFYTRDFSKKFQHNSNFDLFSSPAANWRDSFYCATAPNPPPPQELPQVCRLVRLGLFVKSVD